MLPLMLFGVLQISGVLANDRAFILVGRILQDMSLVLALPLSSIFLWNYPTYSNQRMRSENINSGFEKRSDAPDDSPADKKNP